MAGKVLVENRHGTQGLMDPCTTKGCECSGVYFACHWPYLRVMAWIEGIATSADADEHTSSKEGLAALPVEVAKMWAMEPPSITILLTPIDQTLCPMIVQRTYVNGIWSLVLSLPRIEYVKAPGVSVMGQIRIAGPADLHGNVMHSVPFEVRTKNREWMMIQVPPGGSITQTQTQTRTRTRTRTGIRSRLRIPTPTPTPPSWTTYLKDLGIKVDGGFPPKYHPTHCVQFTPTCTVWMFPSGIAARFVRTEIEKKTKMIRCVHIRSQKRTMSENPTLETALFAPAWRPLGDMCAPIFVQVVRSRDAEAEAGAEAEAEAVVLPVSPVSPVSPVLPASSEGLLLTLDDFEF